MGKLIIGKNIIRPKKPSPRDWLDKILEEIDQLRKEVEELRNSF